MISTNEDLPWPDDIAPPTQSESLLVAAYEAALALNPGERLSEFQRARLLHVHRSTLWVRHNRRDAEKRKAARDRKKQATNPGGATPSSDATASHAGPNGPLTD